MSFADTLRLLSAAQGALLAPACIICMYGAAMSRDQRARYFALALFGVVVVGGQIDAWGRPLNWRLPILVVGLALALYGCIAFLARRRRTDRE